MVLPASSPMLYMVTRPIIRLSSSAVNRAAAMIFANRSSRVLLVVAAMI